MYDFVYAMQMVKVSPYHDEVQYGIRITRWCNTALLLHGLRYGIWLKQNGILIIVCHRFILKTLSIF